MIWLIHSFIDLSKQLTENISTCLIINFFIFIVFWFLLLRIKVHINFVKIASHIDLFESSIILKSLHICYKITQSINTIGWNIFRIAVTVIYFFLYRRIITCFGLPLRLAYSERGFITCPGAYINLILLFHCAWFLYE